MSNQDFVNEYIRESSPWLVDPAFRYASIIKRPQYDGLINLENDLVQVLLGARRIGKTSIMRQKINQLLDTGATVFFLSADNPLLTPELFYELIGEATAPGRTTVKQPVYVFIDEIQDMPGWQKVIKHYYDMRSVKFVVSGSSSLVINQESAKLTGRHQIIHIWPLDYSEAKVFEQSMKSMTITQYLRDGGYPEIVLGKIEPDRIIDIVASTLYRDLLSLYQIRNPVILSEIVKVLAAKVGTPVSFATLAKDLGADDQTISKIIDYLVDMRLLVELPIYTRSAKVQLRNPSKYYFIDSGIVHKYSLQPKLGLLAENAVAVHLEKQRSAAVGRQNWGYELENGQEIDFRIGDKHYEVKYRDDWLDLVDQYDGSDSDAQPVRDLTMIVPSDTNISHPSQKYVGLESFLAQS